MPLPALEQPFSLEASGIMVALVTPRLSSSVQQHSNESGVHPPKPADSSSPVCLHIRSVARGRCRSLDNRATLMNRRAFFLGALLLAIAALITHSIARGFLEESMHRKAGRSSQMVKQQAPYTGDPVAVHLSHTYNVLTTIGIALTGLSVVCMVTALVRHEPGWYLILVMLQVFGIVAAMLL